jgi:hypothetical protein
MEANKADLANEGSQGACGAQPSFIDLIVGTSRVRNKGMKHSRSSHHTKLQRLENSGVGVGVEMSACTTQSSMSFNRELVMVNERIRCAY